MSPVSTRSTSARSSLALTLLVPRRVRPICTHDGCIFISKIKTQPLCPSAGLTGRQGGCDDVSRTVCIVFLFKRWRCCSLRISGGGNVVGCAPAGTRKLLPQRYAKEVGRVGHAKRRCHACLSSGK